MQINLEINIWLPVKNCIEAAYQEYLSVKELMADGGNFEEQMNMVGANWSDIKIYHRALVKEMLDMRIGSDYEKMLLEHPDSILYWRYLVENKISANTLTSHRRHGTKNKDHTNDAEDNNVTSKDVSKKTNSQCHWFDKQRNNLNWHSH